MKARVSISKGAGPWPLDGTATAYHAARHAARSRQPRRQLALCTQHPAGCSQVAAHVVAVGVGGVDLAAGAGQQHLAAMGLLRGGGRPGQAAAAARGWVTVGRARRRGRSRRRSRAWLQRPSDTAPRC